MIRKPEFLNRQRGDFNVDFKIIAQESSNEQIIYVLKKRNHYQSDAVEEFIKEAIKREIIFSEQDLFSEEYKVEELKFSWFPVLNSNKNKDKLRKSIGRSLVICGIVPMVLGIVEVNQDRLFEGVLMILFGLIWILLSSQLIRRYTFSNIISLGIMGLLGGCYGLYKIVQSSSIMFMDIFVLGMFLILLNYGLAFIYKNFRE